MVIIKLANFSSIVAFANQAEREPERLNILIENAGMVTWEHEEVEGRERTYVAFSINQPRLTVFLAFM